MSQANSVFRRTHAQKHKERDEEIFHPITKIFLIYHPFEQNANVFDIKLFLDRFAVLHCYFETIWPLHGNKNKMFDFQNNFNFDF